MTDANLMDADCVHGVVWYECTECFDEPRGYLDEANDFVEKAGRMGIIVTPGEVQKVMVAMSNLPERTHDEEEMPNVIPLQDQIISEEDARIKKMVANAQRRGIPLTEEDVMKAVEDHRALNPGVSILDQVAEEIQQEIEGGSWEPTVISAPENRMNRAQRRAAAKRGRRYQGPDRKRQRPETKRTRG